jgi:hypothetical protein
LVTPWRIALSEFEKADSLVGSVEIQFELVHDPSEQAVIATVPSASELKFTKAAEVEETIWGPKGGRALNPNGITNRHDWDTEKILLTRILSEISGRGILRNKQFGLRPKRSNALQLASSMKECPGTLKRS